MAEARRCIYFVQAEELRLIKIGSADRIEKRLRGLALMSPDRLIVLGVQHCDEGGALETALHARFADARVHGEWFLPTEPLLDYIEYSARISPAALARLNGVLTFPTMPRGRPTREMMRQREVAGLGKWL